MNDDYVNVEWELGNDRAVPDWAWKIYEIRVFRSAIEAAGGPVPAGESLEKALHHCEHVVKAAAQRKIGALLGMVDDEPVPIVGADIVL